MTKNLTNLNMELQNTFKLRGDKSLNINKFLEVGESGSLFLKDKISEYLHGKGKDWYYGSFIIFDCEADNSLICFFNHISLEIQPISLFPNQGRELPYPYSMFNLNKKRDIITPDFYLKYLSIIQILRLSIVSHYFIHELNLHKKLLDLSIGDGPRSFTMIEKPNHFDVIKNLSIPDTVLQKLHHINNFKFKFIVPYAANLKLKYSVCDWLSLRSSEFEHNWMTRFITHYDSDFLSACAAYSGYDIIPFNSKMTNIPKVIKDIQNISSGKGLFATLTEINKFIEELKNYKVIFEKEKNDVLENILVVNEKKDSLRSAAQIHRNQTDKICNDFDLGSLTQSDEENLSAYTGKEKHTKLNRSPLTAVPVKVNKEKFNKYKNNLLYYSANEYLKGGNDLLFSTFEVVKGLHQKDEKGIEKVTILHINHRTGYIDKFKTLNICHGIFELDINKVESPKIKDNTSSLASVRSYHDMTEKTKEYKTEISPNYITIRISYHLDSNSQIIATRRVNLNTLLHSEIRPEVLKQPGLEMESVKEKFHLKQSKEAQFYPYLCNENKETEVKGAERMSLLNKSLVLPGYEGEKENKQELDLIQEGILEICEFIISILKQNLKEKPLAPSFLSEFTKKKETKVVQVFIPLSLFFPIQSFPQLQCLPHILSPDTRPRGGIEAEIGLKNREFTRKFNKDKSSFTERVIKVNFEAEKAFSYIEKNMGIEFVILDWKSFKLPGCLKDFLFVFKNKNNLDQHKKEKDNNTSPQKFINNYNNLVNSRKRKMARRSFI